MTKLLASMEKEMSVSNNIGKGGKAGGKGGKGEKGKGTTGGKVAPTSYTPTPPPPGWPTCRCCGKTGHTKSSCRSAEKLCDNCGKKGRLKSICAVAWNGAKDAAKDAKDAKDAKAETEEVKAPWTCFECFHRNSDTHLHHCEKCHKKRKMPEKATSTKNLISSKILKTIEEAEEDGGERTEQDIGTETTNEEHQKEVKKYEDLIRNAKELGCTSMLQEAEKKLEEVKKKSKQKENGDITLTMTTKDVLGEKTRLLRQHETRKEELEAKAQEAEKTKERPATQKTKAIEKEEKRHKTNLEALEKEYNEADEREQGIVNEITKELEKIAESYEAGLRKINKYLATNAPTLEVEEELKQQRL